MTLPSLPSRSDSMDESGTSCRWKMINHFQSRNSHLVAEIKLILLRPEDLERGLG